MDVKMGVRCFAESELKSTKPRADMYEKVRQTDPSELTAEEIAQGSITKARYLKLRDCRSSTASLGFRIDGIVTPSGRRSALGDLASVRTEEQILDVLRCYVCFQPSQARLICQGMQARLAALEDSLRASELFWSSEFIGSSLFFVADASGRCGLWMLDFGQAAPSPTGRLRHDVPWQLGNHEDGYLTGVANLRRLWAQLEREY